MVSTLDGLDSEEDGMRPRKLVGSVWQGMDGSSDSVDNHVYQGHKNAELPTSYVIGDSSVYSQNQGDVDVNLTGMLSLDEEYPESEYYLDDTTRKWVRRIR